VATSHGESILHAKLSNGRRKGLVARFLRSAQQSPANLKYLRRKWIAIFRNFRERIRLQSTTLGGWVDLGSAFQLQDGCWQENTRTNARAEGIERLKAIHPWADAVDARMFLIGFSEGEKSSMDHPACADIPEIGRPLP